MSITLPSITLPHLIETAADEVASAGRAAAGSLNDLVHDWGHETRSFVSDHASSLPSSLPLVGSRRRGRNLSIVRLLVPVAVLAVVAFVVLRRKRASTPFLPAREHLHETVVTSAPEDERSAEGAAAS